MEEVPAYLLSDVYRRYAAARERLLALESEFQQLVSEIDAAVPDHLRLVARLEGTRAQLAIAFDEEYLPACNDVVQKLFEVERA